MLLTRRKSIFGDAGKDILTNNSGARIIKKNCPAGSGIKDARPWRNKMEFTHEVHTFGPVYDKNSKILILGSFPSVKSRENQFYYGHPQNRFWRVIAAICNETLPETVEEKISLLQRHRIALWDVIASCDIAGSSDSSIKNVAANNMDVIFQKADIRAVFANGDKAYRLYQKYCAGEGQPPLIRLPSTSPANAAWKWERLLEAWSTSVGQKLNES